ncbi:type VII secretion protein EccCa [Actinosynnema sp. NPDC053489]|uniref:type VII secretion protein EccCa n=1 Tax=Actinosynnema sp. NPDC053489 TaxID=3363916 RepID=UPI0037C64D8F
MSVVLFRRPPRRPGPELPAGELQLQEPPVLPERQSGMSGVLGYLPMALGSMGMVLIFLQPGGGHPMMYVAIGLMAVSAVAMLVTQLIRNVGERRRQLRGERQDYLRYLARTRRQIRKAVRRQQEALAWRHPAPGALWTVVGSSRLWERRATHDDFAEVRVALGEQRLGLTLAPLTTKPVEDLEPLCAHALRRFIRAYASVPDQPIALHLRAYARVLLHGDTDRARATARALLAQLVAFHAPEDLRVAVVAAPEAAPGWEWAKWLPHAQHPSDVDGAGPVRLLCRGVGALEPVLGEEFAGRPPFDPDAAPSRDEPYVVVVLDVPAVPPDSRLDGPGYRNCVVLDLRGALTWKPGRAVLRLRLAGDGLEMVRDDRNGKEVATRLGAPDALGPAASAALAARVAPMRLGVSVDTTEPLAADVELTAMLGVTDLRTVDVPALWSGRPAADRLKVPLGVAADGSRVELDIKESALGGMGPHGMLIGATGSGKSELLRTLVLALALTHSSEALNFVLVDFKGGATFLNLDRLPHTSAVITNLADEAALVDRMKDALHGELMRRQELLRRSGNHASALEYERARAAGAELDPLPTLFVVVDEFSELLAAHREFMDLFVMIGRLGRSLGVHLLLASQRLDEGRTHQLESHLSYRIGLRTFSAMESRAVLGVPDAYELPTSPGNGFLKTDTSTLTRFKAAYVSGAYRPERRRVRASVVASHVVPYTTAYVPPVEPLVVPEPEPEPDTASLLEVAVDRLVDAGPPAHAVWLPPLGDPPTLDGLVAPAPRYDGTGSLRTVVGVVDRPFEQQRDLLTADLSGAGGHVVVVGGPQSGKSTLVRTLIAGLALTHSPREVQFYCLDFGGGTLPGLLGLPHVGGVAGRLDTERMSRTLLEVSGLITRREQWFAEHGVDSMPTYRRRRAASEFADEPYGDVFLVVDGWSTIRQDFPDLVPLFAQIGTRGLSYGVHLVVTASRWGELTSALRDQLGTRFELRLGDAIDSHVNIRTAAKVPKIPGRGLTEQELHFLTALPRVDGVASADDLAAGVAGLVETVASAWDGPGAPPVRTLPVRLPVAELPPPEGELDLRVALGLREEDLAPLWHDFGAHPHLLVVGDAESGKTNVLRLVADAVVRRFGPDEAKVIVVDQRRELYDCVPEAHRLGYAVAVDVVKQLVDGAANAMRNRLPGPEVTPARLRRRDWWRGPQLFLVVDDHDLLGGPTASPFLPLLDHLAQGVELGLHVVVARSANGAARGMGDPLLRRLVEVNTPALLLSCPPAEGPVFAGVKPRALVPGRAQHISRRGVSLVQTGLVQPDEREARVSDALRGG